MKKILVAYDGSPESEKALSWTIAFVAHSEAEIHVVTVIDFSGNISFQSSAYEFDVDSTRKSCLERLDKTIQKLCAESSSIIRQKVLLGNPTEELLRHAKQERADLLVCGSHGVNRIAAVLLGSVAHKLVTYATCPVMIVK